ncbi:unnamed protein product [Effrenium voratum]|nr:unnamed protein product [Effrenium voratum]
MAGKGIPMRVLHMKELTEVPVAASLSPEVLWTSHVLPSLPVVRRKVPEALPKSLSFLEVAGHRMVQLKGRPSMSGSVPVFMCNPSMSLLFSDFLETMQWHTESKTICPFYLSKASLSELPELQEAIQALRIPEEFGTCFGDPVPNGVHTYIGCHRNTTSLHFDGYENLMLCVFGAKRIWLFPPSDARFLYPLGESISKPQDFTRSAIPPFTRFGDFSPEMQARFVGYGKAKVLEVQLRAGDLLYLPAGWWHCVQGSEEPNMILNWWFSVHPSKTGA